MSKQTIILNGTEYDAVTGLPVQKTSQQAEKPPVANQQQVEHHAGALHGNAQKSQTLNRQFVTRPQSNQAAAAPQPTKPALRSPQISKFAPHPVARPNPGRTMDIGPIAHPVAAKATQQPAAQQATVQQPAQPAVKPSQVLKNEAIDQAMRQTQPKAAQEKAHKKRLKKHPQDRPKTRLISLASAGLALMLLAGYFTYINMPNLSVRVAASQAGIDASYPAYRPDGYSLSGPVAYREGEVSMKFASNSGPQNFNIGQTKSGWDSSALLENYVKPKSKENYTTYNERGLTIYTYGSNAAWVSGGILYTIQGDAPLSNDQVRRIATSM